MRLILQKVNIHDINYKLNNKVWDIMLRNSSEQYGVISKLLHWVIAIVIITMLYVGYYMSDMPVSDEKYQLYSLHKASGVTLFIFVIIRLFWRIFNISPSMPPETPKWQVLAADLNVKFLYFLMICQPLSGIFMSLYSGRSIDIFGLFSIKAFEKKEKLATLSKEFHEAFAVLLIITISLHLIGALYHHFIKKDGVLKKMLNG